MSDLTLLYTVRGRRYELLAKLSAESARLHNSDLVIRTEQIEGQVKLARMRMLSKVKTPWVLFLDADTVLLDDAMKLLPPLIEKDVPFGTRAAPMHGRTKWDEEAYKNMLVHYGLAYRTVALSGLFIASKALAHSLSNGSVLQWGRRYLRYKPTCWHRTVRKAELMGITLALAALGITDKKTHFYGPDEMSFAGRNERGIVHHFSTAMLRPYRTPARLRAFYESFNPQGKV